MMLQRKYSKKSCVKSCRVLFKVWCLTYWKRKKLSTCI